MKFGLRYCNTGRYTDPKEAIALMQAAEAAGFESAWTVEHIVVPEGYQSAYPYSPTGKMPGKEWEFALPDALTWMAYVAAATTRIKLATGVIILPEHNPVLCAKQVATLDHLSRRAGHPRHRRRLAEGGVRRARRALRAARAHDRRIYRRDARVVDRRQADLRWRVRPLREGAYAPETRAGQPSPS